jgi:hypothetical protein
LPIGATSTSRRVVFLWIAGYTRKFRSLLGLRMAITKLKDVFTPGGQPSITYVGREHLDLEGSLTKALRQGFALNVVTGPTKSGKTVLCTRVLEAAGAYVAVEGGQIRSESDFWGHLAYQLNIAQSATKSKADTGSTQTTTGVTGGVPAIFQGQGSVAASEATQKTWGATYQNVPVLAVTKRLLAEGKTILVDDFHYVLQDVQRAIIQALKGPIFQGLSVIFLAVPHRAFDPITVEDEMQGRFRHISIPAWSQEDLLLIPERGFQALNVMHSRKLAERVCSESFGNPLLVQEICSELCANASIYERCERPTQLDKSLLNATFESVAESKGFPKYRKLREGPQARTDRQARQLKEGGTADIYEAILIALARLGPRARTQYDELRSALRELIEEGQVPQKHEVTAALSQMSKIAREQIVGEPPLEFVKDEDALVITDPFLLFYMKWQRNKVAPGSEG